MKNKALLVVPLIIFTCGVQPVCASENDNITINFVTEEKLEENFRTSLSQNSSTNEIHAYEIDNEGNSKEVNPISNSFRMRKPPVVGFKYSPNTYQHSSGTLNNYFSHVGLFTLRNSGTTSITGKLVWNKYSPSGSLMGIYTETNHSGTVPFNGMTFDVSVK